MLARRGEAVAADRAARRRAELGRIAAERERIGVFRRWMKARTVLRSVVAEIETALAPLGVCIGMTDEAAHPSDLAAVEIRMHLYGRPCPEIIDLTIEADGGQRVEEMGGSGPPCRVRLPNVDDVRARHYSSVILAYVGRVDLNQPVWAAARCLTCGRLHDLAEA